MLKENKKIGHILIQKKLITEETLQHLLSQSKVLNLRLGETAIELGFITEQQLLETLQQQYQLPILKSPPSVSPEALNLLPLAFCQQNSLAPYQIKEKKLYIATTDPCNTQAINEITICLPFNIILSLCSPQTLKAILSTPPSNNFSPQQNNNKDSDTSSKNLPEPQNLKPLSNSLSSACNKIQEQVQSLKTSSEDIENEESLSNSPVIDFVNSLITDALGSGASDIHLELHKSRFFIRYRIDGILVDQEAPASEIYPLIISRIKIISGMDIAEKRRPQDGRLSSPSEKINIDVRVSSLPSIHGEALVLRILNKEMTHLSLASLGMSPNILKHTERLIESPNGIILTTGPTGSGKTSTLYSCLTTINSPDKKIITLEDPVEYQLERVNQMNVNADIGFSFANGLKHILRQDPDVIMVGEIRDSETADIAIRAALTGHLVFSTLHTNDAVSTLSRLLDMGIEAFVLPSTLRAIFSQRLIRKLCNECKKEVEIISPEDIPITFQKNISSFPIHIYEAQGCKKCRNTGYKGRIGIYELLVITERVATLLSKNIDTEKLLNIAKEEGMVPIQEDCFSKVKEGVTSIKEALRVL